MLVKLTHQVHTFTNSSSVVNFTFQNPSVLPQGQRMQQPITALSEWMIWTDKHTPNIQFSRKNINMLGRKSALLRIQATVVM